jgi:DNA repair protein RadC
MVKNGKLSDGVDGSTGSNGNANGIDNSISCNSNTNSVNNTDNINNKNNEKLKSKIIRGLKDNPNRNGKKVGNGIIKDDKKLLIGHRKRVIERFEKANGSLLDYELLEMLLFYVIPRRDTKPIAKNLLNRFDSLDASINANEYQLSNIPNIGKSTITFFKLLKEIYKKMLESNLNINKKNYKNYKSMRNEDGTNDMELKNVYFHNEKRIEEYCKTTIGSFHLEQFLVLFFNNAGKFVRSEIINTGSLTEVNLYATPLIAKAVQNSSNHIIISHNHPSGDVEPSAEDIILTILLGEILEGVEIALLDHLIVSGNKVFSFRKRNWI